MHKGILIALVAVGTMLGFLLGFNVSSNTGVEPGFFETAEAGGYGAGSGGSKATEGLSEDLADYYNDLAK